MVEILVIIFGSPPCLTRLVLTEEAWKAFARFTVRVHACFTSYRTACAFRTLYDLSCLHNFRATLTEGTPSNLNPQIKRLP